MLAPRTDPFPSEAVRDLLGIVRAMYAEASAGGRDVRRLGGLAAVGRGLRAALGLASRHPPGSLGQAAAWERAERAIRHLGDLVEVTTPLEPTVRAATGRVRPPLQRAERERRLRRLRDG